MRRNAGCAHIKAFMPMNTESMVIGHEKKDMARVIFTEWNAMVVTRVVY